MAVNICSLARDTWGEVCERLDHHVAAGRTGFFYETVFEEMTADGSMALAAVIFPAERWYEVDTPADLDAAELVFPRQLHVAGRVGSAAPQRRGGGTTWSSGVSRGGRADRGASRPPAGPEPMLAFARDLPNVCSLAGLLAALLGLFFAIRGVYPAALTALLWAVVFDWSDGLIARRMKGRTAEQRAFGAQLDSLIDVVSFSVAPALLLLSVGDFSPWFIPGAFVILATGVIRLSYFNVFGLLDDSTYRGLPLDTNVIVLALLFVFEPLVGVTTFAVVLYIALMLLAALNVAPIATPKLGGRWYYAVIGVCARAERGLRAAAAVGDRARRDVRATRSQATPRSRPRSRTLRLGRVRRCLVGSAPARSSERLHLAGFLGADTSRPRRSRSGAWGASRVCWPATRAPVSAAAGWWTSAIGIARRGGRSWPWRR